MNGFRSSIKWRAKVACVAAFFAGPAAHAGTWVFEWEGSGGYSMTGALAYPGEMANGILREDDLECFVIEGFLNGEPIGSWGLGALTLDTTWVLTFDAGEGAFEVWSPGAGMPQAWNMDGIGNDCGPDGFGFNIGNAAQDLCVDQSLIVESQVAPDRPFPASRVDNFEFPPGSCRTIPMMSALD